MDSNPLSINLVLGRDKRTYASSQVFHLQYFYLHPGTIVDFTEQSTFAELVAGW